MWALLGQLPQRSRRSAQYTRYRGDTCLAQVSSNSRLVLRAALDRSLHFDNIGNVETKTAIEALSALAQETRLQIYRLLVEAGAEGLSAGRIAQELDLAGATLSFHLAHLARAGLAQSRQDGRFIIYSADYQRMNELVG